MGTFGVGLNGAKPLAVPPRSCVGTSTRRSLRTAMSAPSSSLCRRMIDGANAPIFSVNAEGLVKEWNLKMAELTGFSKKEVLPNPVQLGVGG